MAHPEGIWPQSSFRLRHLARHLRGKIWSFLTAQADVDGFPTDWQDSVVDCINTDHADLTLRPYTRLRAFQPSPNARPHSSPPVQKKPIAESRKRCHHKLPAPSHATPPQHAAPCGFSSSVPPPWVTDTPAKSSSTTTIKTVLTLGDRFRQLGLDVQRWPPGQLIKPLPNRPTILSPHCPACNLLAPEILPTVQKPFQKLCLLYSCTCPLPLSAHPSAFLQHSSFG